MTPEQTQHLAALLGLACNTVADYKPHDLAEVAGVSEEEANAAKTAHEYWNEILEQRYLSKIDTREMTTYSIEDWINLLNTLCPTGN